MSYKEFTRMILEIVAVIALVGLLLLLFGTMMGCGPVRDDFKSEACFSAIACVNKMKDKDTAGCGTLVTECVKDYDEARMRSRAEYCMEMYGSLDILNQETCRLKLAPKK